VNCVFVGQYLSVIMYLKCNVFMSGILKKNQLLQMYLTETE
jgi:hypothetical protein